MYQISPSAEGYGQFIKNQKGEYVLGRTKSG